jgi:hypothetical protein
LALVWEDLDLEFKRYGFWKLKWISGKMEKAFSTDWADFFALLGRRLGTEPRRLVAWCELEFTKIIFSVRKVTGT